MPTLRTKLLFLINSTSSIKDTSWWSPLSVYDLDFSNNRAWKGSPIELASLFSFSRDSSALSESLDGSWSSFSSGVARITNKGILIEPAATNSLRNSTPTGAVAGVIGSGGALPSNWQAITLINGIVYEVKGTGTEFGLPYIDIKLSGTNSSGGTGVPSFGFEAITQIVAAQGQTWTASHFWRVISGSPLNLSPNQSLLSERNSSGNQLNISGGPGNLDGLLNRVSVLRTLSDPLAARVNSKWSVNIANGAQVGGTPDGVTFRIYAPQLERTDIATSPIITNGSISSRSADLATTTLSGSSSGTIYISAISPEGTGIGERVLWQWDDGTESNRLRLCRKSDGSVHAIATSGGTDQCDINLGTVGNITDFSVSFGWENNNFAASLNGGALTADITGNVPSGLTTIRHGSDSAGNQWGGYIKRETLW